MTATLTMTMAHSTSAHALQSINEQRAVSGDAHLSHSPFTLGMDPYPNMPVLVYSTEQKALKSEVRLELRSRRNEM
jgi:hypothetical protein